MTSPMELVASDLTQRLSKVLGGPVEGLRRLTGGASRETWSFTFDSSPMILRRDPPGRPASVARTGGMPLEAKLLSTARSIGMPVPEVIVSGDADPDVLETGFIVMRHVDGETIARKILRDEPFAHARSVVVAQLGAAIAPLHRVDPAEFPELVSEDRLATYRAALSESGYASPAFELGFRWLEQNRPPAVAPAVVHGDYRFGNVIIDTQGLAAILDWEISHLGDPAEDLGWLCVRAWRFGGRGEAAGMGSIEELVEGYRSAGGTVTVDSVRWWMTAGTLVWGVMCISQAEAHLSGAARSVELAAIGRRVAEQEHDLLCLLGAMPDPEHLDALLADASAQGSERNGIHGTPTATGLLAAVRHYLDTDVMPVPGRVGFHARVASNVLATVGRELRVGPAAEASLRADLAVLGMADEQELAGAIRSGALADRHDEVVAAVRRSVTARLVIANPKWFADRQ